MSYQSAVIIKIVNYDDDDVDKDDDGGRDDDDDEEDNDGGGDVDEKLTELRVVEKHLAP